MKSPNSACLKMNLVISLVRDYSTRRMDLSLSFKKAFLLPKKMGNSDTKELNYQEGKCLVVGWEALESRSYKIKIKLK